jgi:hypothetical protein
MILCPPFPIVCALEFRILTHTMIIQKWYHDIDQKLVYLHRMLSETIIFSTFRLNHRNLMVNSTVQRCVCNSHAAEQLASNLEYEQAIKIIISIANEDRKVYLEPKLRLM